MCEKSEQVCEGQGRRIVTAPTHSPLPDRGHDFCAHYDGEEELGGYGYGATEAEAIADFVEGRS